MLDDFACAVLNFVSFVRGMIFRKGTVQLSLLISPFQVDAMQRQNVEEKMRKEELMMVQVVLEASEKVDLLLA